VVEVSPPIVSALVEVGEVGALSDVSEPPQAARSITTSGTMRNLATTLKTPRASQG
jgi:hypothetical protein